MRVLFWAELFWPYIGGAEIFAANLLLSLRERGHELTVVTSHDALDLPDFERYHDIPVYRFPFRQALAPSHFEEMVALRRRIKEFVRQLAPQLVHLNAVGLSSFYCVGAVPAHLPILVRINREHAPTTPRVTATTLLAQVLDRAAWVTGVSSAVLEQALSIAPQARQRSSVVYNGVESASQPPEAPPLDPPHILCLGRLVHAKGFDVAVEAFAAILARWPSLRVTIAGDGSERAALEARVRALGLAGVVEFVGFVAPGAVSRLISSSTLLLMPSRAEGLPAVALQAAAMGRPLVATKVGGLVEIVRHGETGLLVDLRADAFSDAVTALLAQPEEVRRLGRAAWHRVRAAFNQRTCVDAFDELYRRLGAATA